MSSKVWSSLVAAAAAATVMVMMVEGGAVRKVRQANECTDGEECIFLGACKPLMDLLSKEDAASEQTVLDARCEIQLETDLKVCCPKTSVSSTTPPIPTPSPFTPSGEDLLPVACGSVFNIRVVGGVRAVQFAYPWMALLGYKDVANPEWNCGGALINYRYVLTAAHCVHSNFTERAGNGDVTVVRLGEQNTATDPDCPTPDHRYRCSPRHQDFIPEEVIIHETFNARGIVSDDIALIRLDREAVPGDSVRPVCLPLPGMDVQEFLGSRDAVVAGWGATEDNIRSSFLKEGRVPLFNKTKCNSLYRGILLEEQICFGGRDDVDSCFGDSGGPVVQSHTLIPEYYVLGVISAGLSVCGIEGAPDISTSVVHYRKWITDNLKP